jgi:hypothetical protein
MPSEPKLFATTTDGEVPPRILESAEKSLEGLWYEPTTIYKLFKKARVVYGERKALAVKRVPKVSYARARGHYMNTRDA